MASQCQVARTRQEKKDHQLAILIQQQESLAARQFGAKSELQYTQENQDLVEATRNGLLYSSGQLKGRTLRNSPLGDIETDGPPPALTAHPDHLTFFEGNLLLPQVIDKSVLPMMSSRRGKKFHVSDSSKDSHMGAPPDDQHMVWQQTAPVNVDPYSLSNEDHRNSQTKENENTRPFNFNEETLSNNDEESPEIQGASNFSERWQSLGNEDSLSNGDHRNSQTKENGNAWPSNFNEETLSNDDEENFEIQGASNFSERRRSLGNEDEDEISREIDELLKMGAISSSEAETIQKSQQRKFRLNNMTRWQRNCDDEQLRPFDFDTDGIPINWTEDVESANQRTGLSGSMDVRLVELHPGQMEYDKIDEEFNETGIKITKIERIQNTYLLERFKTEMEDATRRSQPGFDLNIRYLYHGTKADRIRVCEEGLDQRLSRMGYFGKGIYFSDNPLKCVHYTHNMDGLGEAYILKCRVILGDSKCFPEGQYDTALKREPEKENVRPGMRRFYDSVVGCPRDYNEFVVYENRRAMIEYIISFNLGPEGIAVMQQMNATSVSVSNTTGGEGEPDDDNHLDRIREVREAVRRKRCQDKGIVYSEPNQQRKHRDDQMWNKLQKIHGVKPEVVKPEKIIPGASAPVHKQSSLSDDVKINNTDSLTRSGVDNYHQEPDPVEQVMSGLLQEFLGVTDTDDVEIAKYYITTNEMNINDALMNYYNDLP